MDWSKEEICNPNVENFHRNENGLVKSVRYFNLPELENYGICCERIKESKGFIYAFENLKLNTGTEQEIDKSTFLTTKHVETLPSNMNFEVNAPIFGFHIHEKSLSQPIIRGPDIPNHQGTMYSPKNVASNWKKDSRMWLWKSIRYACRKNKKKCSGIQPSLYNRHNYFK